MKTHQYISNPRNRQQIEVLISRTMDELCEHDIKYVMVIMSTPSPMLVTNFESPTARANFVDGLLISSVWKGRGYDRLREGLSNVADIAQLLVRSITRAKFPVFVAMTVEEAEHDLVFDTHTTESGEIDECVNVLHAMTALWREQDLFDAAIKQ